MNPSTVPPVAVNNLPASPVVVAYPCRVQSVSLTAEDAAHLSFLLGYAAQLVVSEPDPTGAADCLSDALERGASQLAALLHPAPLTRAQEAHEAWMRG